MNIPNNAAAKITWRRPSRPYGREREEQQRQDLKHVAPGHVVNESGRAVKDAETGQEDLQDDADHECPGHDQVRSPNEPHRPHLHSTNADRGRGGFVGRLVQRGVSRRRGV
jgi:hypothetical protein